MRLSIHKLFEQRAAEAPDAIALLWGDLTWSYSLLNARANQLARHLLGSGVGLESMVALDLERSPEMVAAMLGILKAGAAYVPLDANYPPERRRFMLRDTAAAITIDAAWLRAHAAAIARESAANPESGAGPDHLAYVMYTSGSTGRPKGVMVEHGAVARLVRDADYVELSAAETILQMAPISFDASTFEIWAALLNGGRLALMPPGTPSLDDIARAIKRHRVTTLWLTAGLFHLMVDQRLDALRPLRQLLAGGDVLSPKHVREFLAATPGCVLINGYGPTENTTFTCCHRMRPGDEIGATVPIGRPISGTDVYLLDDNLRPAAAGATGELYAGGEGVARGYLNQPELTAERFLRDPFSTRGNGRLYKTGDLARRLPDGGMEFLGRSDDQIKCNGYRMEPGEIEAALVGHPAVRQAAVALRKEDGGEDKRLVAYIVGAEGVDWREYLSNMLPKYMIPSAFVAMDALPLTANGKVDRGALPAPGIAARSRGSAGDALEQGVAEVWRKVLGLPTIGPADNFFDLGGDSLQLIEAHAELNRALGVDLSITDLFQYTTVSALAAYLALSNPAKQAFTGARDRAEKQRAAQARRRLAQAGAA